MGMKMPAYGWRGRYYTRIAGWGVENEAREWGLGIRDWRLLDFGSLAYIFLQHAS